MTLHHYRSQSGVEMDVVLEDRAGRVAAVEVKLAASVTAHDIKGLASLGDRIFAVPVGMMGELS